MFTTLDNYNIDAINTSYSASISMYPTRAYTFTINNMNNIPSTFSMQLEVVINLTAGGTTTKTFSLYTSIRKEDTFWINEHIDGTITSINIINFPGTGTFDVSLDEFDSGGITMYTPFESKTSGGYLTINKAIYSSQFDKKNIIVSYNISTGGSITDVVSVELIGLDKNGRKIREEIVLEADYIDTVYTKKKFCCVLSMNIIPIVGSALGTVELSIDEWSAIPFTDTLVYSAPIGTYTGLGIPLPTPYNENKLLLTITGMSNTSDFNINYGGTLSGTPYSLTANGYVQNNGEETVFLNDVDFLDDLSSTYSGSGGEYFNVYDVKIIPPNTPPYQSSSAIYTSMQDVDNFSINFADYFKDPESDPMTYTYYFNGITPNTYNYSGTTLDLIPGLGNTGTCEIYATAYDDHGNNSGSQLVAIITVNPSVSPTPNIIIDTVNNKIAFITKYKDGKYFAAGWFDQATLGLFPVIRACLELPGENVILDETYIANSGGQFLLDNLN